MSGMLQSNAAAPGSESLSECPSLPENALAHYAGSIALQRDETRVHHPLESQVE
jgi:hypothetical protein